MTRAAGQDLGVLLVESDPDEFDRLLGYLDDISSIGSVFAASDGARLNHLIDAMLSGDRGEEVPPYLDVIVVNPLVPVFDGVALDERVAKLSHRPHVIFLVDEGDETVKNFEVLKLSKPCRAASVRNAIEVVVSHERTIAAAGAGLLPRPSPSTLKPGGIVYVQASGDGATAHYVDGTKRRFRSLRDVEASGLHLRPMGGNRFSDGAYLFNLEESKGSDGYIATFQFVAGNQVELPIRGEHLEDWIDIYRGLKDRRAAVELNLARRRQFDQVKTFQSNASLVLHKFRRRQSKLRTSLQPGRQGSAFLCHSSGDKDVVRRLYLRLKVAGVRCWLDEEDLMPGQDFDLEIKRALRGSRHILICLSKASVSKAGYVQRELRRALDVAEEQPEGAIFVVPVRLDDCEVPERLRHLHRVDLFHPEGFSRLLSVLR